MADDKYPLVILKDSNGVVIEFKEKYGEIVKDTGTFVTIFNGCWCVTKKDKPSSYYPIENYSYMPKRK